MSAFFGLEVRDVTKSFQRGTVVDNVSLKVPQGQLVCFLGPSGCGKTTLLRIIAGLESASSGKLLVDGRDITNVPVEQRNFAMVFQSLALFPHLSVAENIAYSLRLRGMDRASRQARVNELLDLIKLPGIAHQSVEMLSGGQRQRVAIARAIAQEPLLFLLDEPLSALDAKLRDHMQVELRMLQQKLKITTILVTHDQREAMTIADTIVVMANGKIQQVGAPIDVYRNPANRFVASFVGQSNLLDADVLDDTHVRVLGEVLPMSKIPRGIPRNARVTVSVRPEDTRIERVDAAGSNGTLPGEVTFVRDLGDLVELRVACLGKELISVGAPGQWPGIRHAERVRVRLRADAAAILAS
ncbi:ABC transporter ATP-binding protein [Paraburkholderia strydomiana]|uniref:ABC transporter ATP-binding protein n=1 Tax=Paraburkholderia strydomiana TaxID=1245417 RepID=UPI0038B8B4C1